MIRKKKLYAKPKRLYEKVRIGEENALMKRYALKNKTEIWKVKAKVNYFRSRAKDLAKKSNEEQAVFFERLTSLGISISSIADVLALKMENLLERRLPTIVAKKALAKTPQQARQMVVHKNVMINGNVVNTPSYIVPVSEENLITLRARAKKPKPISEQKTDSPAAPAVAEEAK